MKPQNCQRDATKLHPLSHKPCTLNPTPQTLNPAFLKKESPKSPNLSLKSPSDAKPRKPQRFPWQAGDLEVSIDGKVINSMGAGGVRFQA